jgi:sugar phosphate permease
MEDITKDKITIFGSGFGISYGICLIILGIILAMVTYRYVFPIGSILLILSGLILIFWKRCNNMVRCAMLKIACSDINEMNDNKEIKE